MNSFPTYEECIKDESLLKESKQMCSEEETNTFIDNYQGPNNVTISFCILNDNPLDVPSICSVIKKFRNVNLTYNGVQLGHEILVRTHLDKEIYDNELTDRFYFLFKKEEGEAYGSSIQKLFNISKGPIKIYINGAFEPDESGIGLLIKELLEKDLKTIVKGPLIICTERTFTKEGQEELKSMMS